MLSQSYFRKSTFSRATKAVEGKKTEFTFYAQNRKCTHFRIYLDESEKALSIRSFNIAGQYPYSLIFLVITKEEYNK